MKDKSEKAMPNGNVSWYVYMLRCVDGSLYTGVTVDVARRVSEHQKGGAKCAKYVRARLPVALAGFAVCESKVAAYRLEYAIKQMPKVEKEALVLELAKSI